MSRDLGNPQAGQIFVPSQSRTANTSHRCVGSKDVDWGSSKTRLGNTGLHSSVSGLASQALCSSLFTWSIRWWTQRLTAMWLYRPCGVTRPAVWVLHAALPHTSCTHSTLACFLRLINEQTAIDRCPHPDRATRISVFYSGKRWKQTVGLLSPYLSAHVKADPFIP